MQRRIQNPANHLRGRFLGKQLTAFTRQLFLLKAPSQIFGRVLSKPLHIILFPSFQSKTFGDELIKNVLHRLDIYEKEYFGLRYKARNGSSVSKFIQLVNSIYDQLLKQRSSPNLVSSNNRIPVNYLISVSPKIIRKTS